MMCCAFHVIKTLQQQLKPLACMMPTESSLLDAQVRTIDDGVISLDGPLEVILDLRYWSTYNGAARTGRGSTAITVNTTGYAGRPRLLVTCNDSSVVPASIPTVSVTSQPYWAVNLVGDYTVAFQIDLPEGSAVEVYRRLSYPPDTQVSPLHVG